MSNSSPEHKLEKIRQGLWTNRIFSSEKVKQILSEMEYQVEALSTFDRTAKTLCDTAADDKLPDGLHVRVKNITQFTFANTSEAEKVQRLQTLNHDALKFLGLCHTTTEIKTMSMKKFTFLTKHVKEFVDARGISPYLCRRDLDDVILMAKYKPVNMQQLLDFQTCTIHISYLTTILTFGSADFTPCETEA
jgi:hypothetical protein